MTLPDGRGIAPELGGTHDGIPGIQQNQAMLLAADPDTLNFVAPMTQFLKNLGNGGFHGRDPDSRILLHGAFSACRRGVHKSVGLLGTGQNLTRRDVEGHGLGALGSAVDSESDHKHHIMIPDKGIAKTRDGGNGLNADRFFRVLLLLAKLS